MDELLDINRHMMGAVVTTTREAFYTWGMVTAGTALKRFFYRSKRSRERLQELDEQVRASILPRLQDFEQALCSLEAIHIGWLLLDDESYKGCPPEVHQNEHRERARRLLEERCRERAIASKIEFYSGGTMRVVLRQLDRGGTMRVVRINRAASIPKDAYRSTTMVLPATRTVEFDW